MRTIRYLQLILAVLLGIILLVAVLPVQANPPVQEVLPPRLQRETPDGIWPAGPGFDQAELLAAQESQAPTLYIPWSKLVYQSYGDGNWEIYLAHESTYDYERLTNNAAPDIHPCLNRGATRIVFASKRDGSDYELYTMNRDGTGVTRLTHSSADDLSPTWSPDGSQIAFQSYRQGQSEIFVMNADGTNLRQLTTHSDYDGLPAWSPDGSRIAFVSRRTGGYRVYVVDPNGGNLTQLSDQPYSLDPAWSPDGTQIAFDADGDGDGWQELWVMNADGSNAHCLYNPGVGLDALVGSWSPDGEYLGFMHLEYQFDEGMWKLVYAGLDAWYIDGSGYTILIPNESMILYPHWQTSDGEAPQSEIHPLPKYSRVKGFCVHWSGSDTESGLRHYDIQYRVGSSGEWTDWLMKTTATSAPFTATPETTTYFRSRAHDNRYNVERWPSEADSWTTFYNWQIRGTVHDNRGIPMIGAVISTTPAAFDGTTTVDEQGAFFTNVGAVSEVYTVTWSKSGYGNLPATTFGGGLDRRWDVVLPPADSVIVNGHFDAADGSLDGWALDGLFIPTVATRTWHTGGASALLGQVPDQAPVVLSAAEGMLPDSGNQPDLAVSATGVPHIVYEDWGSIQYGYRTADGTWVGPETIGSDGGYSHAIKALVSVGPSGEIHAAWNGSAGFYYNHTLPDGSWDEYSVVGPSPSVAVGNYGDMVIDSEGGAHVVYWTWNSSSGSTLVYYRYRPADGPWETALLLGSGSVPKIAISPDDEIHVWYGGAHWIQRSRGSVWEVGESLPCADDLVIDHEGTMHGICSGWYTGYYASKPAGGSWSSLVTLANYYGAGELTVDSAGTIYVVNDDSDGTNRWHYFRYKHKGGTWSVPEQLSQHYWSPQPNIAIDASDTAHLVYTSGWTNGHYRKTMGQAAEGTCTIAQAVTLPAEMEFPTLSFLYELHGTIPSTVGAFQVAIMDAVTTTTVYTTSQNGDWRHAWIDVSPWAGEAITVAMTCEVITGSHYARVAVDEVSLGSALPDVWAYKEIDAAEVLPGQQVVYTITYGNRGAVPAIGAVLTDTWPGEMVLTNAVPWPTVTGTGWLRWDVGPLEAQSGAQAIEITATVAPTVTPWITVTNQVNIASDASEVESLNNVGLVSTVVMGPDLWVTKEADQAMAAPGEQVVYTITYGNAGDLAGAGGRITDTLCGDLIVVGAVPSPVVSGTDRLEWNLGVIESGGGPFTLVVTATIVPSATRGTVVTNAAEIGCSAREPEWVAVDNRSTAVTWVSHDVYLPVVLRGAD